MIGRFYSVDPVDFFGSRHANSFNRYAYANNNPMKYIDPDGQYAESPIDIASIAVGLASLGHNLSNGNCGDAVIDAGGIALDSLALGAPGIPGVAGLSIKASREASEMLAKQAAQNADEVVLSVTMHSDGTQSVIQYVSPKSLIGRQSKDEISGSQIKRLAKDMKANGYDISFPIDIADVNGKFIILNGHHRTQAAIKAGIKEVPVSINKVSTSQADQLMKEAAEARVRD